MRLINFFPNIKLINENNEVTNFHDLIRDKTVILNMFYSNCNVKCVPLGKLLKSVNLLLKNYINKEDIRFVSITLDAKNDKPEDLQGFKNKVYDNDCTNWHFYTGNYEEIEKLRFKLGMYSPEPDIDAVKSNHSGGFLIFNESTGFTKHTEAFDNPVDIARKVIQIIPQNFYKHFYDLNEINFEALTLDEIFENIHSMNSVFTVPFLPKYLRDYYDQYAESQRGFQYKPPIEKIIKKSCCCKK